MREPDDAPPVFGDLDRHALAHAAEALQFVVGEEFEIPFDLVGHVSHFDLLLSIFVMAGLVPAIHA